MILNFSFLHLNLNGRFTENFLSWSATENIDRCFARDEVEEIWITFPDPQIKRKRQSKRLTHPNFLRKYNSRFLFDSGPGRSLARVRGCVKSI